MIDTLATGGTAAADLATTTQVRPLDAGDLRLMAAWAAQELDTALAFAYNPASAVPGGHITMLPEGDEAPSDAVVIRARTEGRPVTLEGVAVTVEGLEGQVSASEYGALFWSEAAVQKFIGPFLAAMAGGGAGRLLADLDRIWNGYPDDRPVFALLLRARRIPGRPLAVGDLVDVWHLDRTGAHPALRVTPSADFLAFCHEPGAAPSRDTVAYRAGTLAPGAVLPSEFVLRRMGEWASAVRGRPLYFRIDGATGLFGDPVPDLPANLENAQVVPVLTPSIRAERVAPSAVTLYPLPSLGATPRDLTEHDADAAFWNSGTVTKVLLPYYAVAYGASRLRDVLDVFAVWTGETVQAAPASGAVLGGGATDVFAVIHLPKSDWESEGVAVAAEPVAVVYAGPPEAGGARRTRVAPLSGGMPG